MRLTGKQMVVVVVAVCAAAVLTPTAVNAVTGSAVNITDPVTSTQKARVIGSRLVVGDGSGAMTVDGTVKATDGSGPLTVDGTVSTADPATSWTVFNDNMNDPEKQVLADLLPTQGLTLGTLVVSHYLSEEPLKVRLVLQAPDAPGMCGVSGNELQIIGVYALPSDGTLNLTFSPHLRIPKWSGGEACVAVQVIGATPSGDKVSLAATGARY